MTKTFQNRNGLTYSILKQQGDYSLLRCKETEQYIVAWCLNGDSWGQGYYFSSRNKAGAVAYYEQKVSEAA